MVCLYPAFAPTTAPLLSKTSSRPARRANRFIPSLVATTPSSAPAPNVPPSPSTFNRGQRLPKRPVGHWELAKLQLTYATLLPSPNAPSIRSTALAALLGVTSFAALVVQPLAHVDLELPITLFIATIMSVWAVDTLALNSLLASLAADFLRNQRRVALHEAGHFLVAHLLGMRIESYALTTREARAQRLPSLGTHVSKTSSPVSTATLADALEQRLSRGLGPVLMGGVVGEAIALGGARGGAEDWLELEQLLQTTVGGGAVGMTLEAAKKVVRERKEREARWCALQAGELIAAHREAHEKLAEAMLQRRSVEECCRVIDEFANVDRLAA